MCEREREKDRDLDSEGVAMDLPMNPFFINPRGWITEVWTAVLPSQEGKDSTFRRNRGTGQEHREFCSSRRCSSRHTRNTDQPEEKVKTRETGNEKKNA